MWDNPGCELDLEDDVRRRCKKKAVIVLAKLRQFTAGEVEKG